MFSAVISHRLSCSWGPLIQSRPKSIFPRAYGLNGVHQPRTMLYMLFMTLRRRKLSWKNGFHTLHLSRYSSYILLSRYFKNALVDSLKKHWPLSNQEQPTSMFMLSSKSFGTMGFKLKSNLDGSGVPKKPGSFMLNIRLVVLFYTYLSMNIHEKSLSHGYYRTGKTVLRQTRRLHVKRCSYRDGNLKIIGS
jgi:hypothetical protein